MTPSRDADKERIGVSVIIAALDESKSIESVSRGVDEVLAAYGRPYEVIVVDDGSSDGTGGLAEQVGVKVVKHPYNKGYGATVKTGARRARYPVLVMIDSDGQHDPADITRLLDEMEGNDYDMVVGARGRESHVPAVRAPGKKVLSWVANYLSGERIPDLNSGLRAVRRDLFLSFERILPNQFSLTTTITLAFFQAGYNVGYIPIVAKAREGRSSSVNILTDGYKTFLQVVNTVILFNPNRVFIPASIVLFLIGFSYGIYTVVTQFNIASGAVLCILTSVIVFFFGLIADQLSSIRREGK